MNTLENTVLPTVSKMKQPSIHSSLLLVWLLNIEAYIKLLPKQENNLQRFPVSFDTKQKSLQNIQPLEIL